MIRATILLVFCALAPAGLPAQDTLAPVTIDSGKLVRMHTTHSIVIGRLTARFLNTDAALRYCRYPGPPCLGIEDSAAMRTMPAPTVLRLDVSRGSQWPRGALIGGVLGGVGGALMTGAACSECSFKTGDFILLGIVNGIFWGGVGALVGSAFPRWSHGP